LSASIDTNPSFFHCANVVIFKPSIA
jgi:hypothetical protein